MCRKTMQHLAWPPPQAVKTTATHMPKYPPPPPPRPPVTSQSTDAHQAKHTGANRNEALFMMSFMFLQASFGPIAQAILFMVNYLAAAAATTQRIRLPMSDGYVTQVLAIQTTNHIVLALANIVASNNYCSWFPKHNKMCSCPATINPSSVAVAAVIFLKALPSLDINLIMVPSRRLLPLMIIPSHFVLPHGDRLVHIQSRCYCNSSHNSRCNSSNNCRCSPPIVKPPEYRCSQEAAIYQCWSSH